MKILITYSLRKVHEGGGISQKEAMVVAKQLGAEVRKSYSPYVGDYGIDVTASKAVHRKLEKEYYH